jgi:hypothetical protein
MLSVYLPSGKVEKLLWVEGVEGKSTQEKQTAK